MMKRKIFLVILMAAMLSLSEACFADVAPVYFTGIRSTLNSCSYAGKVTISEISAVDGEDEIGVFVADGMGGEILAGACVMGHLPGYYFVNIYADDTTTEEKDGAKDNEELIFRVWDKSENAVYTIPPAAPYMTYEADPYSSLVPPSVPPVWKNGNIFGSSLLNLNPPVIEGDADGSGDIDLKDAVLELQAAASADAPVYSSADISGDGKIGIEEAVYVLRKIIDN
jgi:hypothetical protein